MGISIWQLLIILVIVLIIFGGKKLRNLGGELGGAIKNFKQSVKDEESKGEGEGEEGEPKRVADKPERVIDGKVTSKESSRQKKA
ncbi:MAG TPA: twin-arginine translocase TatA/TatE family subunit [Acidiferrobacterales bacterium]